MQEKAHTVYPQCDKLASVLAAVAGVWMGAMALQMKLSAFLLGRNIRNTPYLVLSRLERPYCPSSTTCSDSL